MWSLVAMIRETVHFKKVYRALLNICLKMMRNVKMYSLASRVLIKFHSKLSNSTIRYTYSLSLLPLSLPDPFPVKQKKKSIFPEKRDCCRPN